MDALDAVLAPVLQQRRAESLYRRRLTLDSGQGARVWVDGRALLNFCGNDYLGLAAHPQLIDAMTRAASRYGAGAGAAHLVCGHGAEHHALEHELAEWLNRPRALLMSTGFMANVGVIQSLIGRGDAVFEDRLNHASLLDGGLASGARFNRYGHADAAALNAKLAASSAARKLVVSDGLFSMDGDAAPLNELAEVCARHHAWLMVDDAHGLGVFGPNGLGCVGAAGLTPAQVPILVGTLGKAFGSFGAFVSGSDTLIEFLIQSARPYIYSTALPPAVAAASRAALALIRSDEGAARRAQLADSITYFKRSAAQLALPLLPSDSAIQPLLIGDAGQAMQLSTRLRSHGFLVGAIRPPTVPSGTARLRITLTASHRRSDVDALLAALEHSLSEQQHVNDGAPSA